METRHRAAASLRHVAILPALAMLGVAALACDTVPQLTAVPRLTATPERSVAVPLAVTPTTAPTVPTPTPRPTASGPFSCNIVPQETITVSEPLQDVILFTRPVTGIESLVGYVDARQLWALSADGRRIGQLSPAKEGIAAYVAPTDLPSLVLLTTSRLRLQDERIRVLSLPPECSRPADVPAGWNWQPCSNFEFSSDGRLAVFRWGWDDCAGREGAMAMDLATGQVWSWPNAGVYDIRFFSNGRTLVTNMDCEGGQHLVTWHPETDAWRYIGSTYGLHWNADRSAFAMAWESPYDVADSSLAIYNWETDRGVRVEEGENNSRCWSTDGTYLLYQHRVLTFTWEVYSETAAYGPRQVGRIDAGTMQVSTLAADAQHDFHLECDHWKGEWVAVRRVPFRLRTCPVYGICDQACLYRVGEGCPEGDRLALNGLTGELRPWDAASLPPLLPTPTPFRQTPAPTPIPWPSLRAPVYSDPAGRYALYVGLDRRSLWCTQKGHAPVEWVEEGDVYFYVP